MESSTAGSISQGSCFVSWLWSAWTELSNNVHFAICWILTQNHEKPWSYLPLVECDFWQKCDRHQKSHIGHHLKALLMLITMVQSPASYLIHTPRFNVPFLGQWYTWGCSLWLHSLCSGGGGWRRGKEEGTHAVISLEREACTLHTSGAFRHHIIMWTKSTINWSHLHTL